MNKLSFAKEWGKRPPFELKSTIHVICYNRPELTVDEANGFR